MTEKELQELTIFMGDSGACIAKMLKDGKPGKNKRILTDNEMANFMCWYLGYQFKKLNTYEFTINRDGEEIYTVTDLKEKKRVEEARDAGINN